MNAIKQQAEDMVLNELIYVWNLKKTMKNLEINVIISIYESKINCAVDNYTIGKVAKWNQKN